jgi:hypothetical protein
LNDVYRLDPAAASDLERLIADAEAAAAAERAAPFWRPASRSGSASWQRATAETVRVVRRVRRQERADRERLDSLVRTAEFELGRAEERVGRAGVTGRQAALLSNARFRLSAALRLAGAGKVEPAIAAAEDALEITGELAAAWHRKHQRFSEPGLLAIWRNQVARTVAESRRTGGVAIVVNKYGRQLSLYRAGRELMSFTVELGSNGLERKLHAGDRATPEGLYRVVVKKGSGATRYHLALLLDYPNPEDRRRYSQAVAAGEIARGVGIGSLIEIHGDGGSGRDWTDGCVALANDDMERLYQLVTAGTPVVIVGAL